MTNGQAARAPVSGTWLGHPKGLLFLSMTEAWERFSFYGMRALLVLYMVQELLLPGHIENVAGMAGFRAAVESVTGPLSTQAFASQTFGLYAGLVYFTPVFGGLIADRWLGARQTVMIGILLMTAGHFLMTFEWSVLIALLLLILGSGCLKGNIAAQVGHLYGRHEEARRSRGYVIFSTGINIGAMLGPLLCGLLAQVWGWHYGFGLAGVMMLGAAAVYFSGLRHFAAERPRGRQREKGDPLTGADWKRIGLIFFVLGIGLTQTFAYDQTANVGMIWLAERTALDTPFGQVPEAWFMSEDPLASILVVPLLIALWRWQASRGKEPHDLGKIATGGVLMACSCLCFALGEIVTGEGRVSALFPFVAYIFSGVSFMFMWPTTLALVSRRAPSGANAMMMAMTYLTGFVSGIVTGYLASYYEPFGPRDFWIFQAGLAISGSVVIWLFGNSIMRAMDRLEEEADLAAPSAAVSSGA